MIGMGQKDAGKSSNSRTPSPNFEYKKIFNFQKKTSFPDENQK